MEADGQLAGAAAVGEEAEVADAYEAAWQYMKQKPAQELIDGQGHQLLLVAMGRVAPAKSDVAAFESNESVVGDSHTMGVGAKVS